MGRTFRIKWWRRTGEVAGLLFISGLALVGGAQAIHHFFHLGPESLTWTDRRGHPLESGQIGMALGCLVLFVLTAVAYWIVFLRSVNEIRIEPDAIHIRTLIGRRTLEKKLMRQVGVSDHDGLQTIQPNKGLPWFIRQGAFVNGSVLHYDLEEWWRGQTGVPMSMPIGGSREFSTKGLSLVLYGIGGFFVLIILFSLGSWFDFVPCLIIFGSLAALACLGGWQARKNSARVTPQGIDVVWLGKRKSMTWSEVTALNVLRHKSSRVGITSLVLESASERIYLGQGFDDFDGLYDLIRHFVPKSVVRD